ncbi:MAG: hypothetical protein H7646_01435, partial [Candidatus Heimdallarchaeota archaeon]|nr:hypothetical protein [Candidatus Heimdallarchaeota archaeon]
MKVDVKRINLKENDLPLVILGVLEEAKEDVMLKELNETVCEILDLGD